jgi:hypothetical protein
VLRELLGVLLEVCAHVEAHGAQLERVRAQLERLDARVSTLEREGGAALQGKRFEATAAGGGRALTLVDLSTDALDKVLTFLYADDELAAALACRKLRDAIISGGVRSMSAAGERRPLRTGVRSLLGSLGKLQWGVACAGAPMSAELISHVAGLGDLRMLG